MGRLVTASAVFLLAIAGGVILNVLAAWAAFRENYAQVFSFILSMVALLCFLPFVILVHFLCRRLSHHEWIPLVAVPLFGGGLPLVGKYLFAVSQPGPLAWVLLCVFPVACLAIPAGSAALREHLSRREAESTTLNKQ